MVMARWVQIGVLVGWVRIDWLVQVSKEEFHERLAAAAEHAPELFAHFKSAAAAKKAEQAAAVESEMQRLRAELDASDGKKEELEQCVKQQSEAAAEQVHGLEAEVEKLSAQVASEVQGREEGEAKVHGLEAEVERLSDGLSAHGKEQHEQMSAMEEQVRSVHAEMEQLRSVHKLSREESDGIFELYDVDGNGTVDMNELMEMIAAVKNTESSQLNHAKIKQVWDSDGDGQVGTDWCAGRVGED